MPSARAHWLQLDLASCASVRGCAHAFLVQFPRLDLLFNAAGLMAIPWALSEDGVEMQWAVNFLGHFLLTGATAGGAAPRSGARVGVTARRRDRRPAPGDRRSCSAQGC